MLDPKLIVMLAITTLMLVSGVLDMARRRRQGQDGGL